MGANFTMSKKEKDAAMKAAKNQQISNREEDHRTERIVCDFLMDAYFNKKNPHSKLITSLEMQLAGIDIEMESRGQTYNVDVKAQASEKYINNPTDTFVLELDFFNENGYRRTGWFLNDELKTDFYSFVWVLKSDVDENRRIHSKHDLEKVQIMTVHKEKLSKYIMEKLSKVDVEEIINSMRMNNETYVYLDKGIHFSYSPGLKEKPVNLVVKKWLFEKFATAYDTVTIRCLDLSHYNVTNIKVTQDNLITLIHPLVEI